MFFVDSFEMELITENERDNYAAPERYYEYREGVSDNIVTESYIVSYNPTKVADFSYSINDDRKVRYKLREIFFDENNIKRPVLYAYTVPPLWYKEETEKCLARKENKE